MGSNSGDSGMCLIVVGVVMVFWILFSSPVNYSTSTTTLATTTAQTMEPIYSSPEVKGEALDMTHPATKKWLKCRFGYRYFGGPRTGHCAPFTLLVRPGDTVGHIATWLGQYDRWGELCHYPNPNRVGVFRAGVRLPGEFNVRRIMPGDRVGGCA